ncbi:MAG: GNAT family N-acetyltransferase [Bacteroidota bacterium]
MTISYQVENKLSLEEFRSVLVRSTLGERRPIDEPERLEAMVKNADLIITARDGDKLVGVARSLTDFQYCTYLSDLAVDQSYQKQGIGKELIRQTKLKTQKAKLILLAAPAAIPYYPKIGMTQYEFCYYLDEVENLR